MLSKQRLYSSVWFGVGLGQSRCACVVLCGFLLVRAGLAAFVWFCVVLCGFGLVSAGLLWSLPFSPFCAGFVLVSAGLCRFRCFVLVLRWSLLVAAGFANLCWFCGGLHSHVQVGDVVSTRMCTNEFSAQTQ